MSMNCVLADAIARVKNAKLNDAAAVDILWSKQNWAVFQVLKNVGIVSDITQTGDKYAKRINVTLYASKIRELSCISTPGRSVHVKVTQIPRYKNGFGVIVISTSSGMMTGAEAKARGIGGKLMLRAF